MSQAADSKLNAVDGNSAVAEASAGYVACSASEHLNPVLGGVVCPPGYKQTEVGVIPEDWQVTTVGKVVSITTGNKNTQDKITDGLYPFFVRSQQVERINTYSFDGEGVLTAGDGVGTGKIFHHINGKFDFHQRVYLMYNFGEELDGYYFYIYFSNNFYDRIMSMTAKSSVDSVRREMIADMLLVVPPKGEQIAIANALSDVDALVSELEKLIAKKQAIKTATMQQLLTGRTRLPQFALREDGTQKGTKPSELGEIPEDWEVDLLGTVCGSFKTGKLDANAMKPDGEYRFYTCAKEYSYIDKYAFDDEALLVSGNGANVGYVHYYKGKFNAYQRTYVLTSFLADVIYLKIYLEKKLAERIRVEVNAGNTPYITMDTLTDMSIVLPPKEEQTAIATILSDMDEELQALEQRLGKTRQIKQGMMQELLTGRTRLVPVNAEGKHAH